MKLCSKQVRTKLLSIKIRQLMSEITAECEKHDLLDWTEKEYRILRDRIEVAFKDEYLILCTVVMGTGKLTVEEDLKLVSLHRERMLGDCKMVIPFYQIIK